MDINEHERPSNFIPTIYSQKLENFIEPKLFEKLILIKKKKKNNPIFNGQ